MTTLTNERRKLGEELSRLYHETTTAYGADCGEITHLQPQWREITHDEIREGMTVRTEWTWCAVDCTRTGEAYERSGDGWITAGGECLTWPDDPERYYTPVAASDLPREISRDELQALPEGAVFQRIATQEYVGSGTSRVLDVRFRLISLPEPEPDPDQPLIDAFAASGLTEAQARVALDAITAIAVIELKSE